MKKIIPILLLIMSIIGLFACLFSLLFALLSFAAPAASSLILFAVPLLVFSCIFSAPPVIGGIMFYSKICRVAMVISLITYALIIGTFILLFSR